jgi:hypothetical protein
MIRWLIDVLQYGGVVQPFSQSYKKFGLLVAIAFFLVACVSAPVQEMSDARQAIRAAREAGATTYSFEKLNEASESLERAERKLEAGSYFEAKRHAVEAREKAIRALERTNTVKHEFAD